jgi:hypothetical protein
VIAVYCGKATESGLSAEWTGLIGVIAGALIGLLGNFLLQRYVLQKTQQLELGKIRSAFISQNVLADILKFLDSEAKYHQQLRVCAAPPMLAAWGAHREELSKIDAMIKMFEDATINDDFWSLLRQKDKFEEIIIHQLPQDKQKILNESVLLVTKIKKKLLASI